MVCLDHRPTDLNEEKTYSQTVEWIERFGPELKGIVTADILIQKGINRAMKEQKREDLICVSHWSPQPALELIRRGTLKATTYQSGIIDGILSLQTAVDWF